MNHKRRRPKNRRSGCLLCKYWKVNGFTRKERHTHATQRRIEAAEATRSG